MAKTQKEDPETLAYRTSLTALQWQDIKLDNSDTTLLCDVSTGRPRPLIPQTLRKNVFDLIHNLSHPSGRSTAKMLKEKFIWHSITKDAKAWARSCPECQQCKVNRHTKPQLGSLPQPTRRFSHIHVDIVGPLPYSNGYKYLFTAIDRSTSWPEAIPMQDATATSCVSALLSWISRFGIPEHITSDRGTPFTSQMWSSLAKLLGTTPHHTTSYHPESNGIIERFHRSLKASLMATCSSEKWCYQLPWVLLGLRTSSKEDHPSSPAERVYGQALVVPGEFFPDKTGDVRIQDLRQKVAEFAPCRPTHKPRQETYVPDALTKSTHAFIRIDALKKNPNPPLHRAIPNPATETKCISTENKW